jgi:reactive intermediate/imine deaminase
MDERVRFINPPTVSTPTGYSHVGIAVGPLVFVSGQIALDVEGRVVGAGDMRAQAEQVFANLGAALAAAGSDFGQVVKLTIFVTDMSQMPVVREVRNRYVDPARPPASTAVEISRLARDELMLEVEAVAVTANRR